MLVINYVHGKELQATYKTAAAFVAMMELEVPEFEDYYEITKVTEDGTEIDISDKTMGGLFNYLLARK
ncbi:hypothetical protein [Dellaglioa algida]|uniref:hypothetical protein n=1 Tax=Dellaglioa algida TaxID=105612 RepID=UPI0024C48649|nr:hypothetical protein [Dellaglioa algida]MDK1728526.1 hypothetical protein [Dellaglioa algida]MDK1736070.1 hypothetical protein [Dellaglioa algida]MDK1737891.1 hypothetical protein [Dellaglioa algida]